MMTQHPYPQRPGAFPTCPLMQITGPDTGPRLVVTGPRKVLESLAEHLWNRPALGGIRGVLILRDDRQTARFDLPDELLNLDDHTGSALSRTLGLMTALGMIQGSRTALSRVA